MRMIQLRWDSDGGWAETQAAGHCERPPALVLVFGDREALTESDAIAALRARFPGAELVGCSTAGEILGTGVLVGTVVATAIAFDHTQVEVVHVPLAHPDRSRSAGAALGTALRRADLAHVLVLSAGVRVNGSALVAGLREVLPAGVQATGGLAGDGSRFEKTLVVAGGRVWDEGVAGVGLYGGRLLVGHGSMGGWDPFGPERVVTRSEGNVVYELDGQSALALYRSYLGEHAQGLPASGLLFPLSLRAAEAPPGTPGLVRTLLGIDEEGEGLIFAGDIPQGGLVQLMRANFNRLVDGAAGAAESTMLSLSQIRPEVGILISCVGRRLVLRQRAEEETEAVQAVLGAKVPLVGFYSYGEISPLVAGAPCELHNQTMTITALAEL